MVQKNINFSIPFRRHKLGVFFKRITVHLLGNFFLAAFLLFIATNNCFGQNFGLGFYSHETTVENRTGLHLTQKEYFELKDSIIISFDMKLLDSKLGYFGYIFRCYLDNKQNIDLIHRLEKNGTISSFTIIKGTEKTLLVVKIPFQKLRNEWHMVKLIINSQNESISLTVGDSLNTQSFRNLKNGNIDMFFGVSNELKHPTTDVPAYAARDIKVWTRNKLAHNWPLNETQGNIAKDIVNGLQAKVNNPMWINASHTQWKLVLRATVNGYGETVWDRWGNTIYFIGKDTLKWYSFKDHVLNSQTYLHENLLLIKGNQAIWDPFNNQLLAYSIDAEKAFRYNTIIQKWGGNFTGQIAQTIYSQHNKTIYPADSSLYCFAGYGQFKYKNDVFKLKLNNLKWEKVNTKGDFFKPRYLSALGVNSSSDTAYIIGGFGSESGDQIMNPDYYYDFVRYSFKDSTFKVVYEFSSLETGFCFANSLYIDDTERKFYGLTFPKNKYENTLQLFTGSLDSPEYSLTPTGIPFLFDDIKSYADLFYLAPLNQLIAITSHLKHDSTTVFNVYSISFPPIVPEKDEPYTKKSKSGTLLLWLALLVVLGLTAFSFLFMFLRKKKRKRVHENDQLNSSIAPFPQDKEIITETISLPEEEISQEIPAGPGVKRLIETGIKGHTFPSKEIRTNSIFLFGKLRLYDKHGEEISNNFSPLLKELFLLILLNSFEKEGISSQLIDEILWFDKSVKSAQNNRAVNIAKLRTIFNEIDGLELKHERNLWSIDIDQNQLYCDYFDIKSVINSPDTDLANSLRKIDSIASRGALLQGLSYEWLDEFKSACSDFIIDVFLDYMGQLNKPEHNQLIIKAATTLSIFDPVNEEAMRLKCKAYISLGHHSMANDTYARFVKDYKALYGEAYKISFNQTIK
jgi:two-component SAPR family response regulator